VNRPPAVPGLALGHLPARPVSHRPIHRRSRNAYDTLVQIPIPVLLL